MKRYVTPTIGPELPPVDVNGGFLCMWVYWRPDPKASDPEMPGQKLQITTYIPVEPEVDCLCGSGKPYGKCCRLDRYWQAICPNPDMGGYSLVAIQEAKFTSVDIRAVRERLMADPRLNCVEDNLARGFWTFWGEPAVESRYGIICFGDFELLENQELIVTAMSEERMRVLLELLLEIAGDLLKAPEIEYQSTPKLEKWVGRGGTGLPRGRSRGKGRKR